MPGCAHSPQGAKINHSLFLQLIKKLEKSLFFKGTMAQCSILRVFLRVRWMDTEWNRVLFWILVRIPSVGMELMGGLETQQFQHISGYKTLHKSWEDNPWMDQGRIWRVLLYNTIGKSLLGGLLNWQSEFCSGDFIPCHKIPSDV